MDTTATEMPKQYPELEFRVVPVDLSAKGYVEKVAEAIQGINVQVCFLNAGYIQTGFFVKTSLEKNYANLECNVGHVVGLSHLLINHLQTAVKPGCLVFTSSAAAVMPAPFASLYNSTKAFLSAFGSSVAAEVRVELPGVGVLQGRGGQGKHLQLTHATSYRQSGFACFIYSLQFLSTVQNLW